MVSFLPQPREVVLADGAVEVAGRDDVATSIDPSLPTEGYRLEVGSDGAAVAGGSAAGVFYGLQTFQQLLPASALRHGGDSGGPWRVPALRVTDAPRFGWRGVMLDVARHFLPLPDVLRFIDLAARHKLNLVHLHLTDDQGWRLAVPAWPRLASVAAWRRQSMLGAPRHARYDGRPHGGLYSPDDLREMAAFAAARHITIVPEVDMPGHMQAALAAYPELGNGHGEGGDDDAVPVMEEWGISTHILNVDDATLGFCRDVLDLLCDVFPATPFVGIGGDECPPDEWRASPRARRRADELGLPDVTALHGWFVAQMAAHLRSRGRRAYAWDEVLAGGDTVPSDLVVGAWRGPAPTTVAARRGLDVVACPNTAAYLDYRQSDHDGEPTPVGPRLDLHDVYAFEPVPDGLSADERQHVVGAQANVWTEHMDCLRQVEYMTFPRLCAFAEVAWGKPEASLSADPDGFADFGARMEEHLTRLDALAVNYRPPSGPRPWDARPDAPGDPRSLAERLAEVTEMTADLHLQ